MNNSNTALQYSEDALNVKAFFYNKRWMVYVEGKDDIVFWNEIFSEISNDFQIQEVDGYSNLIPYMDSIIAGTSYSVVARDRDHSYYLDNDRYSNDCIITTYGYSIENTMYCRCNINNTIKKLARKTNDFSIEIDSWYNDFCHKSLKLLPYDIINYLYGKGISCFGDTCHKFLVSNHSEFLDDKKINSFIEENKSRFTEQEIDEVNRKIEADSRENQFKIKGHFLTNGVINLIKKQVQNMNKTVVLSNDAIYALMVTCHKRCSQSCLDKTFVLNQIENAYNVLIKNRN